jgi:two-component system chemotaxis response regulator CheY
MTGGKHILIVDDSPSMRTLLAMSLSAQGHQVETAEDGVHGLERLPEVMPDLLFTDINMPRMDGFGLIEAVRAQAQFDDMPILVLSTESSAEKKNRAFGAGASGWLVKPFDPERLGAAIRRVCP